MEQSIGYRMAEGLESLSSYTALKAVLFLHHFSPLTHFFKFSYTSVSEHRHATTYLLIDWSPSLRFV